MDQSQGPTAVPRDNYVLGLFGIVIDVILCR